MKPDLIVGIDLKGRKRDLDKTYKDKQFLKKL